MSEHVMGTVFSLDVRATAPDVAARAAADAFALLREAEARFSPFLADSELRRFERGECAPSSDLREVLAIAERASADSGGAFDVRAPDGSLDTNGVVKGWAAQRAADALTAAGCGAFCLNAGGDVVTRGAPEPGRGWRTGVRDPHDPRRMLAVVELGDGAVATSGVYERGSHVWDGRTGRPATGLLAATVVADDLTTADVLATSVLALGPDGVAWALDHGARDAFGVRPDGRLVTAARAAPSPGA
ncbi:FAD:protein FMN transferase [Cellulomonas sp. PSBB021]|uniref:FAD:protein FMN transferase n=1 Tax=Cellulomonas sp. PSBB021 TaxID=2003551 RepID=UPI001E337CAA|nr:FAD:protein FMN transferase [Cellulomonas sp. PSBB021]